MKKLSVLFVFLFLILIGALPVSAGDDGETHAEEKTGAVELSFQDAANPALSLDGNTRTFAELPAGGTVTVNGADGIASVVLLTEAACPEILVTESATGEEQVIPGSGYLHTVLDLSEAFGRELSSFTLTVQTPCRLTELRLFGAGTLPEDVEDWKPPLTEADLLLISAHSDDDTLFFAGLLPTYVDRSLEVQVAYYTNHAFTENYRMHELLQGLWHMGIRNYPLVSDFPDLYSTSLPEAAAVYRNYGFAYERFPEFIVELVQKTHPKVIVTHDPEGEYGHGTHRLCTQSVIDALPRITAEGKTGLQEDGSFAISKIYFHLYPAGNVTLDLDVPLDSFHGKTAFQVSQEAFQYHRSQHWTWFYKWIYYGFRPGEEQASGTPRITRATEIPVFSPTEYGLYYSAVGADETGMDLFEHLTTYAEERHQAEIFLDIERSVLRTVMMGGAGVILILLFLAVWFT